MNFFLDLINATSEWKRTEKLIPICTNILCEKDFTSCMFTVLTRVINFLHEQMICSLKLKYPNICAIVIEIERCPIHVQGCWM